MTALMLYLKSLQSTLPVHLTRPHTKHQYSLPPETLETNICINFRPMKLDYQFLAQIFEKLMRVGGYYSLFIIFQKAQRTSQT